MEMKLSICKLALFFTTVGGLWPIMARGDCDGLAKYGVYDVRTNLTASNRAFAFRNWFCSKQFKTAEQASNAAGEIGIPIYDIPVKLGFSSKSSSYEAWQSSYCSDQYNSSSEQSLTENYVATVNSSVVSLISQCMARPGVHASIEIAEDPHQFVFTVQYNRFETEPNPKVESFFTSSIPPLDCEKRLTKGDVVRTAPNSIICHRSGDGPVTVVLNTTSSHFVADTPMSLNSVQKAIPTGGLREEACRQLFSNPRSLSAASALYVKRLKLYKESLLKEEQEIRDRYPGPNRSLNIWAFDQNEKYADAVSLDIQSRVNNEIDASIVLNDYVQSLASTCGPISVSQQPAMANLAAGTCQTAISETGSKTDVLHEKSVSMENTVASAEQARMAAWKHNPRWNQDPSEDVKLHDAAVKAYFKQQQPMEKSAVDMISAANDLIAVSRRIRSECRL